jgi:hypothetical protein
MRAFGLIGLLLVAAIIAYLAVNQVSARSGAEQGAGSGLSVPGGGMGNAKALQREVDQARRAVAVDDLQAVRRAITLYRAQEGHNPDNLGQLVEKGFIDRAPADVKYDPASGSVEP